MTPDEVKNVFKAYLPAKRAYDGALLTARRMREEIDGLRGVAYDGMPHGAGPGDPVGTLVMRFAECLEKLTRVCEHYRTVIIRAENLLNLADDNDGRTIIRLRWFEDVRFEDIAVKLYYEERQIYRIYAKTISEIAAATEGDVSECQ